jgi:hypothetical protein
MPLETINNVPAAKFWEGADAHKKAVQEFVDKAAKMAPAEAAETVNKALNGMGWALDEKHIENGAVVEAKVSQLPGNAGWACWPLKAFPKLKKITIAPELANWLDLAPLMSLPIEEIKCSPATVAGNAIILRQMPTLKTINGKAAKEVLAEVK